jgi:hypothetical protein
MKKVKISLALCCCLGLGLLFAMSTNIMANTAKNNEISSEAKDVTVAKDVLIRYLEAYSNQDVDDMLHYVIDKRYSPSDLELQKQEYAQFIQEQKLVAYKINNILKTAANQIQFETVLTYENGGVERVPIWLVFDKTWKLSIDELDENYEVIKEADGV